MNILFVCTGNTCRSPMAEAILKHKQKNVSGISLKVKSVGLSVAFGSTVATKSKLVLKENKLSTRHIPTQINKNVVSWADLILTMTEDQAGAIKNALNINNVFSLGEYVGFGDVFDPFGQSEDVYRRTYNQLDMYCDKLIEKLLFLKRSNNE